MATQSVGYLELLRQNKAFRRLWYGQIVSQLGDWFNSIALYALLYNLTGSGQAVGALLVAQFLPATLVGPWSGVIVDRLPRKMVLIVTDVMRAVVVLALLLVREPGDIWIIYVVTVLNFSLAAFFEPARSATIPMITRREELVAANAISGATWSAMLALGAGIGGFVAGLLGTNVAFVLNSITFLLSAVIIAQIRMRETHLDHRVPSSGLHDLREGLTYMLTRKDIVIYATSKAWWSLGGGVLLLLTIVGQQLFPLGEDSAISIGLLYAARGIGTGIGPILARQLGGESISFLRRAIGPSFLITTAGYIAFSGAPNLAIAMLVVGIAHMGGSIQWVFSTALLQMHVPKQLQGRIFAIELALLTFTTAVSSYMIGLADDAGWEPRTIALVVAGVFMVPGIILTFLLWRTPTTDRQEEESLDAEPLKV